MRDHALVEVSEPLFTERPDGTFKASTEPFRWRCRCGARGEAGTAEETTRLVLAHVNPTPETTRGESNT